MTTQLNTHRLNIFKVLVTLISVCLTAATANAYISASPSYVSFYSVAVGSYGGSRSIRIANNGPEVVGSLSVTDSCYGGFAVRSYGCYGPLSPYQSCSIDVSFNPTREGYQSCTIRVSSELSTELISVSGTGTITKKGRPAPSFREIAK